MKKLLFGLAGLSIAFLSPAQADDQNIISVTSSTYISNCNSSLQNDCTTAVQTLCNGKNICSFLVSDTLCGDPDPNCRGNHLNTQYDCSSDGTHNASTQSGNFQTLACIPH